MKSFQVDVETVKDGVLVHLKGDGGFYHVLANFKGRRMAVFLEDALTGCPMEVPKGEVPPDIYPAAFQAVAEMLWKMSV